MTTTLMARSDPTKSQFPSISEPPSRDSDAIAIYLAALAQHPTPYYNLANSGGFQRGWAARLSQNAGQPLVNDLQVHPGRFKA